MLTACCHEDGAAHQTKPDVQAGADLACAAVYSVDLHDVVDTG